MFNPSEDWKPALPKQDNSNNIVISISHLTNETVNESYIGDDETTKFQENNFYLIIKLNSIFYFKGNLFLFVFVFYFNKTVLFISKKF